jgi:rhodanese-related sulfurtransferase
MRKSYVNHMLMPKLSKLKQWLLFGVSLLLFLNIGFNFSLSTFSERRFLGYSVEAAQISQMSVENLKSLIDSQANNFVIVDVRTPQEYQIARISDAVNVPLADIQEGVGIKQLKSIGKNQKIILYCSAGVRSAKALNLLEQAGVSGINLQGGIREWRTKIEPNMPKS